MRALLDAFYRAAIRPLGTRRRPGTAQESPQLLNDTDAINRAAEHYFATFDNHEFLLNKPFSEVDGFPRHLFSLGVTLSAINVRPTDVVVEFGSGTCWASHFLNRYGCRTISIDVSPTALALGRQVFERDPATRWNLNPEFLPYDGRRLPLPDACCDKIIVIDAFHHIPNQREILREMHRILKPDGVIGMSEPGLGHAASDASRHEVEHFGVLENELVIEDVAALARTCGFSEVNVVMTSPDALWQVPAETFGGFLQGDGFVNYWRQQTHALLASHYIVMAKGDGRPTTRETAQLRADIAVHGPAVMHVAAGARTAVSVTLVNSSGTRWLSRQGEGWTRLGAHLYRAGAVRDAVSVDWLRVALPHDVSSNAPVTMPVVLPEIQAPGTYDVVFDLIVEGSTWFEAKGSPTATVQLVVT